MSRLDPLNVTVVTLLLAFVVLVEWAARRGLFGRWFDAMWARLGSPLPLGLHRVEGEVGIHFGREDAVLILRVPLPEPGTGRPRRYVAATDGATRFTIEHEAVSPYELLEAYDDAIGPLVIQVCEPGRVAEIDIAPRADADRRRATTSR